MATLKELADRTGYSPATISRILSGDPALSVTPEARRKVLEEEFDRLRRQVADGERVLREEEDHEKG